MSGFRLGTHDPTNGELVRDDQRRRLGTLYEAVKRIRLAEHGSVEALAERESVAESRPAHASDLDAPRPCEARRAWRAVRAQGQTAMGFAPRRD